MSNDIPKKVIDVTGIELTPGEPTVCLGNGEQGFECCCDECDYFLLCFPEIDIQIEEYIKYEKYRLLYEANEAKILSCINDSKR